MKILKLQRFSSVERHLISGSTKGIHYFDPSVNPGSFESLKKDITLIAERMKVESKIVSGDVFASSPESESSSAKISRIMNINLSPSPGIEPVTASVSPSYSVEPRVESTPEEEKKKEDKSTSTAGPAKRPS